jgi:hypothetical protein
MQVPARASNTMLLPRPCLQACQTLCCTAGAACLKLALESPAARCLSCRCGAVTPARMYARRFCLSWSVMSQSCGYCTQRQSRCATPACGTTSRYAYIAAFCCIVHVICMSCKPLHCCLHVQGMTEAGEEAIAGQLARCTRPLLVLVTLYAVLAALLLAGSLRSGHAAVICN